jgi:hypothetical protein
MSDEIVRELLQTGTKRLPVLLLIVCPVELPRAKLIKAYSINKADANFFSKSSLTMPKVCHSDALCTIQAKQGSTDTHLP